MYAGNLFTTKQDRVDKTLQQKRPNNAIPVYENGANFQSIPMSPFFARDFRKRCPAVLIRKDAMLPIDYSEGGKLEKQSCSPENHE